MQDNIETFSCNICTITNTYKDGSKLINSQEINFDGNKFSFYPTSYIRNYACFPNGPYLFSISSNSESIHFTNEVCEIEIFPNGNFNCSDNTKNLFFAKDDKSLDMKFQSKDSSFQIKEDLLSKERTYYCTRKKVTYPVFEQKVIDIIDKIFSP